MSVFEKGNISRGPEEDEFRKLVEDFVGPGFHAALVNSGTTALTLAAKALSSDIATPNTVIVPAYGPVAIANGINAADCGLVFADVCEKCGNITAESVNAALRSARDRTPWGVCFVDFSGCLSHRDEVKRVCIQEDLIMIEDASQAFGMAFEDAPAGTIGDIGTFSFSVPKWVTCGQGGAIVTKDNNIAAACAGMADQGRTGGLIGDRHTQRGNNLRLPNLLAAIALGDCQRLEPRKGLRTYDAIRFQDTLHGAYYRPASQPGPLHNIVWCSEPDVAILGLANAGFEARRNYRLMFKYDAWAGNGSAQPQDYPGASHWADHALYLPFSVNMTDAGIAQICKYLVDSGLLIEPEPGECPA